MEGGLYAVQYRPAMCDERGTGRRASESCTQAASAGPRATSAARTLLLRREPRPTRRRLGLPGLWGRHLGSRTWLDSG